MSSEGRSDETTRLMGNLTAPIAKESKASCFLPTGPCFQWTGLFIIAFITFGTSVAYDSVGALGPIIRAQLHIDAEGLADLYSVYHLPNLVLVFFGGLLSDRIGVRRASLIFSFAVVFGVFLVAISKGLFGMLFGRFIFGMGSESLSVVQLGILSRWFSQTSSVPSLGLACAFSLTINRLGTIFAFDALPLIAESGGQPGLYRAFLAVFFVTLFCLGCNISYTFMDNALDPFLPEGSSETRRRTDLSAIKSKTTTYAKVDAVNDQLTFSGVLSNLKKFSGSYWLIVLICICHYSVMISYSDFATDFYHEHFGFNAKKASQIQSITTIIGLVMTPIMGFTADRFGHRAHLMLVGSLLLLPAHIAVSILQVGPWMSSILQGLASALVCSSLWPSIALVLPFSLVNTAVGLMTALQNSALFTVPLIVGAMRVKTGRYIAGMFLYIGLDAIAVLCCLQLISRKDQSGTNILTLNASQIQRLSAKNTGALDSDDQACEDDVHAEPHSDNL